MNKNSTVFVLGALIVVTLSLFFWRSSRLQTVSNAYEQVVALSPASLSYRSARLPLSGNGLLFYKAHLNQLPFTHTIDKMSVKIEGSEVQVNLTGMSFDVKDALRGIYGENLVEDLKSYVPYQSIFTRPLQSLALAGIERVKLNAKFTLNNIGVSRQIVGEVQDKKIGRATFNLSLPEKNGLISVDNLTAAPITSGEFSFEDVAFEEPYRAYAKSLGITAPDQGFSHVRVILPIKDELQKERVYQKESPDSAE